MTGDDVVIAAQLACLLEASAPKPGNVSPGRHFRDARYEDFLASAAAIGPALARAGERPLGATVLAGVEATGRWTRSNTNLGIVLLLAPLARAGLRGEPAPAARDALRAALGRVLEATTVADARDVYAAIRRAAPGGLGRSAEQDVAAEPTVWPASTRARFVRRSRSGRRRSTARAATGWPGTMRSSRLT